MKRYNSLIYKSLLSCAAGMLFAVSVPIYAETASGEIAIVYTNDVHCAVEADAENGRLGYAAVAGLRDELDAEGYDVILIDVGDAIQGEAIGTLSDGAYLVDILEKTGYDIAVPGNHEFDYGMEQFLTLAEEADYDYISCNFTDLVTGESVFPSYVMKEAGEKKIAFVGICTPYTITSSTPTYFQDEEGNFIYGFQQGENGEALYTAVQNAVDEARAAGADYVIAAAHLGIETSCSPWTSVEVIENTTGIDVVLDAHSHSVLKHELVSNKDGEKVILTSTGTKLNAIGQLIIAEDGSISTELITEGISVNTEVESYVQDVMSEFDELLNEVVAYAEVDLVIYEPSTLDDEEPVRIIRNAETNMGDLCADAYRYVTGADIAMVNGGGVRANILSGDVTYNDIINVHPFGNEVCMVEATGQEILDALEMGARYVPEEDGSFQHVSGLTYEINLNVEQSVKTDENDMFICVDGEYRVQNVMVGDEPLDLEKTYTVASHNYLLKDAGGGLNMFVDCPLLLEDIMLDNQALLTYIEEGLDGVIGEEYADPYGQGRIVAVE